MAKNTAAPSLSSPATRKQAREAADAMLSADVGANKAKKGAKGGITGIKPGTPKATTDKPSPASPPVRPAIKPQSPAATAPMPAAPSIPPPPPGWTPEQWGAFMAASKGATGAKRGRQPRPRCDYRLRVEYLTGANIAAAKPGDILTDFPDLWGTGRTLTVCVLSPQCDAGPGKAWAYGIVCGDTGEAMTDKRAKAWSAAAKLSAMTGGGDYLNSSEGSWITLEPEINSSEAKSGAH